MNAGSENFFSFSIHDHLYETAGIAVDAGPVDAGHRPYAHKRLSAGLSFKNS